MPDSNVASVYIPAYKGNYTANRINYGGNISMITIHHCAGIMSIDDLARLWQRVGRNGSSHYGVRDDRCAQFVLEKDIAWTNSNWNSNINSVTIEVSNSGGAPNWPVSDASIETTTKLVADIAERYNLFPLVLGKNVTYHSMYSATACPGPYLKARLQKIVDNANAMHDAKIAGVVKPTVDVSADLIKGSAIVTVGPASSGDVAYMEKLANVLQLNCVNTNGTMEIGPMSYGDQKSILTRAKELGLKYVVEAWPREKYAVTVEGFTSKADADAFVAECAKKNLAATAKKL